MLDTLLLSDGRSLVGEVVATKEESPVGERWLTVEVSKVGGDWPLLDVPGPLMIREQAIVAYSDARNDD